MASFRQRGGKWQARVLRDGYPHQAKTFESRADAERWARTVESSIDKGQFVNINEAQRTTLGDVIERYLAEVTPTMKSALADTIRLRAMMRRPLARLSMVNLSAARIAAFRDEWLKQVSAGTVIRELAYLSAIINHARREWGINVPNPVQMVRKPSSPPARARVLSEEEVSRLLHALEPTADRSGSAGGRPRAQDRDSRASLLPAGAGNKAPWRWHLRSAVTECTNTLKLRKVDTCQIELCLKK